MKISLLVAASQNWVIGRDGKMPWKLSSDLKRFKKLTMGHPIVMGRKTYESIGRLLPGRTTIIITRQADYAVEGAVVVDNAEAALAACQKALGPQQDEAFVVGGAEIYKLFLPQAERIYLTMVHTRIPDGDTYFPMTDFSEWDLEQDEEFPPDEKNQYATRFEIWERLKIADT